MELFSLAGENTGLFIALITILGLVVGSFLNVVIHRIPIMMRNQWNTECCELLQQPTPKESQIGFNLLKPDSHCPKCHTPIRIWHNVPLLSYLALGGKCAQCKSPISLRYPSVELVSGVLSGFIAYSFGATELTFAALFFTWALISLTMIDIDHQLLPDNITLPLLWLGLMVNSQHYFTDLPSAVFGAAAGYMVLWSVFWLFKLLTGKEGMGFGDFKLLAALGAWMGWQQLPLIIILSSFVGAVLGIAGILIQGRNKSTPIPFGPYLAIAGWVALLWGDKITSVYLQMSGLQH